VETVLAVSTVFRVVGRDLLYREPLGSLGFGSSVLKRLIAV
jgi:hypothetical protein